MMLKRKLLDIGTSPKVVEWVLVGHLMVTFFKLIQNQYQALNQFIRFIRKFEVCGRIRFNSIHDHQLSAKVNGYPMVFRFMHINHQWIRPIFGLFFDIGIEFDQVLPMILKFVRHISQSKSKKKIIIISFELIGSLIIYFSMSYHSMTNYQWINMRLFSLSLSLV